MYTMAAGAPNAFLEGYARGELSALEAKSLTDGKLSFPALSSSARLPSTAHLPPPLPSPSPAPMPLPAPTPASAAVSSGASAASSALPHGSLCPAGPVVCSVQEQAGWQEVGGQPAATAAAAAASVASDRYQKLLSRFHEVAELLFATQMKGMRVMQAAAANALLARCYGRLRVYASERLRAAAVTLCNAMIRNGSDAAAAMATATATAGLHAGYGGGGSTAVVVAATDALSQFSPEPQALPPRPHAADAGPRPVRVPLTHSLQRPEWVHHTHRVREPSVLSLPSPPHAPPTDPRVASLSLASAGLGGGGGGGGGGLRTTESIIAESERLQSQLLQQRTRLRHIARTPSPSDPFGDAQLAAP